MSDRIYNPDSEKLGCCMKLACDYFLILANCFAEEGTVFWECSEKMFDSIYRYLYHVCMWAGYP